MPNGLRRKARSRSARPKWRALATVVIPAAKDGIITGIMLNLARVAGETAPLLFTSLNNQFWSPGIDKPTSTLPVMIYTYALSPYDDWQQLACAAGFDIADAHSHHQRLSELILSRSRIQWRSVIHVRTPMGAHERSSEVRVPRPGPPVTAPGSRPEPVSDGSSVWPRGCNRRQCRTVAAPVPTWSTCSRLGVEENARERLWSLSTEIEIPARHLDSRSDEARDRVHRSVGLRQVHVSAHAQPDAGYGEGRARRG